jgi:hypothetical protein
VLRHEGACAGGGHGGRERLQLSEQPCQRVGREPIIGIEEEHRVAIG